MIAGKPPPPPPAAAAVAAAPPRPRRSPHQGTGGPSCSSVSASATLDLFIFVLVLFSCAFLIISSLSYVFRSLPVLLEPLAAAARDSPAVPYVVGLAALIVVSLAAAAEIACRFASAWSRRCENPRCKGLRKALKFDVQLRSEESLRSPGGDPAWKEIDDLPWKGGQGGNNPDYECLRSELRRIAPPNGCAVLLFRSKCGCPVAKLEGWGPKRGRRNRRGTSSIPAVEGGGER